MDAACALLASRSSRRWLHCKPLNIYRIVIDTKKYIRYVHRALNQDRCITELMNCNLVGEAKSLVLVIVD